MRPPPQISVVIPAFNRTGPLRETLASALSALRQVSGEIVLVDDGSQPPLTEMLGDLEDREIRHVRQANQGSIVARLRGLAEARGEYVLFLDSDDLLHPDKFGVVLPALRAGDADIVYDDLARPIREGGGWRFEPAEALRHATDPAQFFLRVQPVPHSPTYRREYLLRHLGKPLIPARRRCDPAGDVWLYYNLCAFPARIVKVDRALTAIGVHDEDRYSRHWERIAAAALEVMEEFAKACPAVADMLPARITSGECAFDSWRRLPRRFHRDFEERMLRLWRNAPRGPVEHLGGPLFTKLARLLGPERAGRLLRLRNQSYAACRTVDEAELHSLLG